jgi:RNA polymerase sigma-70 factor (ECF subfamily)
MFPTGARLATMTSLRERDENPMSSTPSPPADEPASPAVIRVLVENHRQFLAFLERRIGDRATAEDILQEAFVRGMNKLDTLRSDESAVAWFYRLLRNAVIDFRRRSGATERKLSAFQLEIEKHSEPEAELQTAICQCVGELATTLKDEYAEALRAIDVEGLPVKEFAQHAKISPSNAGVRIFRAREALRKQVARSCGTCADHGCLSCTCARSSGARGTSEPAVR